MVFVIVGIAALIFAYAGAYVATQKNREPLEGALLGGLLGPIGLLIAAVLPEGLGPDSDDQAVVQPARLAAPRRRRRHVPRVS